MSEIPKKPLAVTVALILLIVLAMGSCSCGDTEVPGVSSGISSTVSSSPEQSSSFDNLSSAVNSDFPSEPVVSATSSGQSSSGGTSTSAGNSASSQATPSSTTQSSKPASSQGAQTGSSQSSSSNTTSSSAIILDPETDPPIDAGPVNNGAYFSVKSYGAKGDGSADDTAAVADAISAASGGGVVYFPEGRYKISSIDFPKTVGVAFEDGAVLVSSGTVKVNASAFYAGYYQIFEGGTVSGFENIIGVFPQWWGATVNDDRDDTAAIQKAINACATVYFPQGEYNLNHQITFPLAASGHNYNLIGAGPKKTIISIGDGITGFLYETAAGVPSALFIDNLGLVGTAMTSTGVNYKGQHNAYSRMDMSNCYIKGLQLGVTYTNSGGVHFYNNYAEYNYKVYEVGSGSMFLYWDECHNRNNSYFIYCDVAASGGVSNGIMITGCTSVNSLRSDVHIHENQTVFIEDSYFGGTGNNAHIYLYNCCDLRITNTIISGTSSRDGIHLNGNNPRGIYENNKITNCRFGMNISDRGQRFSTLINDNTFNNVSADIYISSTNLKDMKIWNNKFESGLSKPISGASGIRTYNVLITDNTLNCASYNIGSAIGMQSGSADGNTFKG